MTREQAKREIDSLDYYLQNHTDDYGEESHTAMMMAIKALEQEPCEDAISRQAVEEIINDIRDCISVEGYCAILERLNKLPSVNPQEPSNISNDGTLTVNVEDGRKITRVLVCGANHWGGLYYPDEQEPKTGHWEWLTEDKYRCSNCNHETRVDECMNKPMYDFCPFCGVKMESEGQA